MFKKFGLNAVYLAFEIEKSSLGLAFEAVRSLNMQGVNLTIPFKEEAVNFVDEIPEDLDRALGALNTIANRDGVLYGYNTDMRGFLFSLKEELSFNPEGKTALILGAGGAARAMAFGLAHARAERILIHNRTPERAAGLVDHLDKHFPETDIKGLDYLDGIKSENIHLVVNSTSLGLKENDESPIDLKILSGRPDVYDVIYSAHETALLKQAGQMGLKKVNGLGMLANQAALAFEIWTGKSGVREQMKALFS